MSQSERIYRTHALVLRRRDYSDADRVLTLYTPRLGKLEVLVKGVRKTTSRKAGHLELFTHTSLQLTQARTWDLITEAVLVESFRYLRDDLDAISRASYVCELLDAFTESEDENVVLWDLVLTVLRVLDEPVADPPRYDPLSLLRWFELHLLSVAGFQPQLFVCLGCEESLTPVVNFLSLAEGGFICPTCARLRSDLEAVEPDVLKILRYFQSHSWPEVRVLAVRPHILRRCENILYRYLLLVLERRLKSVDFLRKLQ